MKTLDRYIIRNFLSAALVWFLAFMVLRIIVDMFFNMGQFAELMTKDEQFTFGALLAHIVHYYQYQSAMYFTELGGVIITASAAFSLARMNQSNELTAIMASGVSLRRVVIPIIICSLGLGGLIVADQELLIPNIRSELVRDRDDRPGVKDFRVRLEADSSHTIWLSGSFQPYYRDASGEYPRMKEPLVMLRDGQGMLLGRVTAAESRWGKLTFNAHGKSEDLWGWHLQKAQLSIAPGKAWPDEPDSSRVWSTVSPKQLVQAAAEELCKVDGPARKAILNSRKRIALGGVETLADKVYGFCLRADSFEPIWQAVKDEEGKPVMDGPGRPREEITGGTLVSPMFEFRGPDAQTLVIFGADYASWHANDRAQEGDWELANGEMFVPSDLSPEKIALRQSSNWLDYMSSRELSRLLELKQVSDPESAMLTKYLRIADPVNNLVMLLLGLPFILSRERNIKRSAGWCLLVVSIFYAFVYVCRYMQLEPFWAAWMPLVVFGGVAAIMWDSVKT
jgi:lipopolysaccharide export LptBFGC system permease protein LptF